MNDFFHGWRRKAGVLTLMMACVVMALWLRSLSTVDHIEYEDVDTVDGSGQIEILFHSSKGVLTCFGGRQHSSLTPFEAMLTPKCWSVCLASGLEIISFDDFPAKWTFRHLGIEIGILDHGDKNDHDLSSFWVIPYWSVVLPLMLLSGYLLLIKPRQAAGKNIAEATAIEGS